MPCAGGYLDQPITLMHDIELYLSEYHFADSITKDGFKYPPEAHAVFANERFLSEGDM